MRTSEEIKDLIIGVAAQDDRIRAVLLTGSRANSKISPDKYQDFDITYVVDEVDSFISDKSWPDRFGDRLICQLPADMAVGKKDSEKPAEFALLMLFTDGNRIDLTLVPKKDINANYKPGTLTIVWLDKDSMFPNIGLPNESDFVIKKPTVKEFLDTCNEFWWVCTYVAKGLARNEIIYAKEMLDTAVRPMFMNVVSWHVGIETNFSVSIGKGRFLKNLLPQELYRDVLATYSDHVLENNWKSLFLMTDIFGKLARRVSEKLAFTYLSSEEKNVTIYLDQLYHDQAKLQS